MGKINRCNLRRNPCVYHEIIDELESGKQGTIKSVEFLLFCTEHKDILFFENTFDQSQITTQSKRERPVWKFKWTVTWNTLKHKVTFVFLTYPSTRKYDKKSIVWNLEQLTSSCMWSVYIHTSYMVKYKLPFFLYILEEQQIKNIIRWNRREILPQEENKAALIISSLRGDSAKSNIKRLKCDYKSTCVCLWQDQKSDSFLLVYWNWSALCIPSNKMFVFLIG